MHGARSKCMSYKQLMFCFDWV